jgi:SSS family solute:Na+ symporter
MKNIINLSTLDIIIIAAYVAILLGIAAWASFGRKRQGTLFLANRSLGWFTIGLTLWGTNVGPLPVEMLIDWVRFYQWK